MWTCDIPPDCTVPFQDLKNLSCRGTLLGIYRLALLYEICYLPRALLWHPACDALLQHVQENGALTKKGDTLLLQLSFGTLLQT